MTRAVLAERWWIDEETNRTVGLGYPNVCNTAGALGFVYALYAAWRRSPAGATLGIVASVGLKLWWLRVLVDHYDQRRGRWSFRLFGANHATEVSTQCPTDRGCAARRAGRISYSESFGLRWSKRPAYTILQQAYGTWNTGAPVTALAVTRGCLAGCAR